VHKRVSILQAKIIDCAQTSCSRIIRSISIHKNKVLDKYNLLNITLFKFIEKRLFFHLLNDSISYFVVFYYSNDWYSKKLRLFSGAWNRLLVFNGNRLPWPILGLVTASRLVSLNFEKQLTITGNHQVQLKGKV